jgi:predicted metal-dependent enzyme (double-stranded beta helix superfamily)
MVWFTSHPEDEYFVDDPELRIFVAEARKVVAQEDDPARRVERLKPAFGRLLERQGWLPEQYRQPDTSSGMGSGIGQYLLFRAGDRSLTLFALVVPPGASTPVHDHLAWGLVGLYQGEQREEVYELLEGDPDTGSVRLRLATVRLIRPGEFYPLVPPQDDIHRVTTVSSEPSVSLHLLGNDTGCVVRHRFDPERGASAPFRSGYSNAPCPPAET